MMNGRWPLGFENLQRIYESAEVILSISADTTKMILLAYPTLDPRKILQVLPSVGEVYLDRDLAAPVHRKSVTYMSHRLPDHAAKVCYFLQPYLPTDWALVEIGKLKADAVARALSASSIFMSFCDLEGFGLPPPLRPPFVAMLWLAILGKAQENILKHLCLKSLRAAIFTLLCSLSFKRSTRWTTVCQSNPL